MIAIIDYKVGNLRSVQKACEFVGFDAKIVHTPESLKEASHIILPGVGAFADAYKSLCLSGLREALLEEIGKGKPFLGICLGMQMLFEKSFEDGEHQGLGLVKGYIKKFDIDLKVPHMGWNSVIVDKPSKLYENLPDNNFYFVHSYRADESTQDCACSCNYGETFCAGVQKNNVFGVQFHPEKSGETGLKMLRNFGEIK